MNDELHVSLVVLNSSEDAAVANVDQLQSVLENGVVLGGGPGVNWLDGLGESVAVRSAGRLTMAEAVWPADSGPTLGQLFFWVDRDLIRFFVE